MIDNFDTIKPLFYFNEANNMFFHLQILRRGKDHPELPAANKLIQSWLVRSRDHLDNLKEEIIFLCEHYKARAYINVAGKDFKKLNTLILKKLADNIHTGNIINPWHVYNSACGELKSRRKCLDKAKMEVLINSFSKSKSEAKAIVKMSNHKTN